jgi:hypothetical protein
LKVREHFLQYPLQSTKLVYFQLWSIVLDMMVLKEHLILEGLLRIAALKAFFPLGLSLLLKNAFPSLPLGDRPEFTPSKEDLNSHWIAGFANGNSCFTFGYTKRSDYRLGATCFPRFFITQHERDEVLLNHINSALGCGEVYDVGRDSFNLQVTGLSTLTDKIVPLFSQHPLHGAKALDFADFCKGISIMNQGVIRLLLVRMN